MQSWWRVQLERKKFLEARRERIRKKQEVEDSFLADPNLRRVLLLNKETRVRLTAVEESHGTKVFNLSIICVLLRRITISS